MSKRKGPSAKNNLEYEKAGMYKLLDDAEYIDDQPLNGEQNGPKISVA
jgi:hypothetical protein